MMPVIPYNQIVDSEKPPITFIQYGGAHQYMAEYFSYKDTSHYLGIIAVSGAVESSGVSLDERLGKLMLRWLEDLGSKLRMKDLPIIIRRRFSQLSEDEILGLKEVQIKKIRSTIHREIWEIFVRTVKEAFQCDYVAQAFIKSRKMNEKEMDHYAESEAPWIGLSMRKYDLSTSVNCFTKSYHKKRVKEIKRSRLPHNQIKSHVKSILPKQL